MRTHGGILAAIVVVAALGAVHGAAWAQAESPYTPPYQEGPPLQIDPALLDESLDCPAGGEGDTVILIPGTTLDPESNFSWNYQPAFEADGRAYCTLTLPNYGMTDIQLSAEYVVHALRTVSERDGGARVDIVGYSQGGMIGRWALRFWPDTRSLVDDLIGIAPPNHGTDTAVATCQQQCAPSYQQQRSDAAFIEALNSYQETFDGIDYTVVYTWGDEVVTPNVGPTASSPVTGDQGEITNVAVQEICPGHAADHLAIGSSDPVAYAVVVDALDNDGPADPSRIDVAVCAEPFMPGVDPATYPTDLVGFLQTVEEQQRTAEQVAEEPPLQCYALTECADPSAGPTPAPPPGAPDTGAETGTGSLPATGSPGLLALGAGLALAAGMLRRRRVP